MQEHIKRFDELTPDELYDIIKLRIDVFVVEQECAYMELDGLDKKAVHVWLSDDDGIKAYLRVMDRGVEHEFVSIGRVVTAARGEGLGRRIMDLGIRVAEELFGADNIYLEAQTYAQGFYAKHGFSQVSDVFMLDGIPHVKMVRQKAE